MPPEDRPQDDEPIDQEEYERAMEQVNNLEAQPERAPLTYLIGISYVGGPEYLVRAVTSIGEKHWKQVHVINSSDPCSLLQGEGRNWADWQEGIPSVPLSHTQTHNLFQSLATGRDVLFVQHNDAEAEPDTYDQLLALIPTLPRSWGAVFTNYDAIAAYNPRVWEKIGGWDWRLFPSYYSDNDYYRRMKLAGFTLHESELPVKHEGSHIINNVNKQLKWLNHNLLHNSARTAYLLKWGGDPGEETYTKAFNGALENPYADE